MIPVVKLEHIIHHCLSWKKRKKSTLFCFLRPEVHGTAASVLALKERSLYKIEIIMYLVIEEWVQYPCKTQDRYQVYQWYCWFLAICTEIDFVNMDDALGCSHMKHLNQPLTWKTPGRSSLSGHLNFRMIFESMFKFL